MTELEFAERLKKYRRARGLTQQELADRLGVSNKSVSRWESGGYPDMATLGPLARALGVTVDDLLNEQAPIRSLNKSDWQTLLSFAFSVGGGMLFFLLDLFAPLLVCYLLYLGSMAYGVYLQRHYTYQSKWFWISNGLMNLFVNLQLLAGALRFMLTMFLPWIFRLITSQSFDITPFTEVPYAVYGLLCLLSAVIMTAATQYIVLRKGGKHSP